jgi:WD40 repeat protein
MIRTRTILAIAIVLLCASLLSAQVRLAEVAGKPGTLNESTTVVFKASSNIGYLSNPGSGLVQKFRAGTGEVLGSVNLPPGVGPIALSFDERTLVVLCITNQRFYILDAETLAIRTAEGIGYQPSGFTFRNNIVMSRDGLNFYCADPSRNHVAVFNTTTKQVDRFIQVDKNPNILTLLPNGQYVAVVCSGKKTDDVESVWIIDTLTISPIDNPAFRGAQTEPFNNVQFTANSGYLFMGSYSDNRLLTYDLKSKIVGSRALMGGKGPAKVVSSPNGRWLAVVNVGSKTIDLMTLPEAISVNSITFSGFEPTTETTPAFSADGHTLYIPAAGTGDVIAYDVENMALLKRISTKGGALREILSGDGTVLTSLDVTDNVLSLIAINPTPLYVPDLTQSATQFSGLAFANFGAEGANIALVAKDDTGALIPGTMNPRILSLGAKQQTSLIASQIFGIDPTKTFQGYIEAYTLGSSISLLYMTGTNNLTQMDGFLADSRTSKLIGFGRITEGILKFGQPTSTEIIILNPTESEAAITSRMFATTLEGPGSLVSFQTFKIPAHTRLHKKVSELVTAARYPLDSAYLEISADVVLKGLAIVKIGDSIALVPATIRGDAETTFDAVQFASGGSGVLDTPIFSNLGITNVSNEPIELTAEVTDDHGEIVPADSSPITRTLHPYEAISGGADELLGFPDPLTDPELYQGTLHMEADKKGLAVCLLYGDARDGKYLTTGSLVAVKGTKFAMTHFAEGAFDSSDKGQYYTGIALRNPSLGQANLVIEAFAPDGTLIGSSNLIMDRRSRKSATLSQLVPGVKAKASTGFVVITSDVPIMVFEVFGSSRSEFLVSVAPVLLSTP